MALEDFFTLTEMKDGLTTPDRVEELINLTKKENEKDVKNVEESLRQWCTVARTIACTDNQECLDRFVQLNGLSFINMWLNDINKCASDSPNNFVEESMVAMLLALEKLQIDDEKLASSGIGSTLRSLIVHTSSLIKDRAMMLLDRWKQPLNTSTADVDTIEDMHTDNYPKASIKQNESCTTEDVNEVKDIQNVECGNEVGIAAILDSEAVKKETTDTLHSTDLSIMKDSSSITGSMGADAELTNTGNESPSSSKREAVVGSLERNIEVLAGGEDIQNGKTTILVEQVGDFEHHFTHNLTVTEARSNEAKDEEPATEAAQQDSMIVASEIMDNPGPDCSYSQEKIQDGPTEQLSKSLPQEASPAKEFSSRVIQPNSSDSIIVQPEDGSNRTEPSHVNAVVVQETETSTRAGELGFDLNEEVLSEDLDPLAVPSQELKSDKVDHYLINQTSVATSVVSALRASAVPGLLAGGLQFEGTSGWKGSAATSAFRQASPRRPAESDNVASSNGPSSSSEKKRQLVHDFDLNMADDGNADNTTDSVIAVSSSHHSEESCVEIGPRKSKRVELDLNSLGDAPQSSAFLSKNGHPFSKQNAYRSPSPASSSSSVHPTMWDVDLNKKLSVPNFPYDPQPYLQNSTFNIIDGHTARKPVDPAISIMGARVDVGREQNFQHSPFHPNASITGMRNFFPPSMNNNPPCPPMQSFMYRPGIPITMVDSRGSPVMPPQMIGPVQQPYLMNMIAPPPNGFLPMPPSFDPNMLYMNNETALAAVNRGEQPYPRQYLMSSQGSFLEPHSTTINAQPSPWVTKRNVPHAGWDPYRHGSKHQESPGKT